MTWRRRTARCTQADSRSVQADGAQFVGQVTGARVGCASSTRSAPLRVVQGIEAEQAGRPAGESPVRELLQWRGLFDTKLVEITDYGFAAVTRLKVDDALLSEVEKLGWRLVIGDATELAGLAGAYQRAASLRSRVLNTGMSVRVDEVSWTVTGLLGREAV